MPELTKQLLIKVSEEMDLRIEKKYSEYLKRGVYLTKSEFIRCLLNQALTDRELSYDEICLLGSFLRDKNSTLSTWRYKIPGWEGTFDLLYKKGYLDENKNGAYIISEEGEKIWNEIPFDQKKHLKIPTAK